MKSFSDWKKQFDNDNLLDFSRTNEGLLWLKLRSIDRKDLLSEFCAIVGFHPDRRISAELVWQSLAAKESFQNSLSKFMQECQARENAVIDTSFETIRSNLYGMTHFHWGGGFRNSLDKAIVSRYVKTECIIPFEKLEGICDGELREMSRGYLLNSWYNYWSSVLIENLFKRTPGVLPALGKIKNVDFFVDDFPFDLKVTYLPKEYTALVRKQQGIVDPMKLLKTYAKRHRISVLSDATPEQMRYEIVERMKDSGDVESQSILSEITDGWSKTVQHIMGNKSALIRWLYENQGDMRFGAENRIFLVLVDMSNPDDSWKLKRNVDLIAPSVSKWVYSFNRKKCQTLLTEFVYNSRRYETYADVIFVVKE